MIDNNKKEKSPLISVCIPVYNSEQYINETIISVIKQNYDNLEILIQDNASNDNTKNIIDNLSKIYPELSVERNDLNVGMAPNWNLVIKRAKGQYIMLLSADDLLEAGFLHKCLEVFNRHEVDVVTTNHFYLEDNIKKKRKIGVSEGIYRNFCGKVLLCNPFSINFTLFTREAVKQLSIQGNLFKKYYTCDYDLWIRQALIGLKVYYLDEPLATYRVHATNLSKQVKRMSRQTALVLLNNKKELKKNCIYIYRFTLFRFLIRSIKYIILNKSSDKRLMCILYRELLKS